MSRLSMLFHESLASWEILFVESLVSALRCDLVVGGWWWGTAILKSQDMWLKRDRLKKWASVLLAKQLWPTWCPTMHKWRVFISQGSVAWRWRQQTLFTRYWQNLQSGLIFSRHLYVKNLQHKSGSYVKTHPQNKFTLNQLGKYAKRQHVSKW